VAIELQRWSDLPRLPADNTGPVFAEPWQAQAFALAVTLSEQGHFTWKEWSAALAHELQAGASRGEPDDGSRYYEHWLAALERMVTTKGLAERTAIITRKEAWAEAYRTTPHGRPVELPKARPRLDARWLLLALASAAAAYGLWQSPVQLFGGTKGGLAASAGLGALLGMRHAFEPDHLAAISTLLTGERNIRRAAWLGVYWGIGHTLTLLVAGTLLVVLRTEMPPMVADVLAWAVVLMLVWFGFRALALPASETSRGPTHSHRHGLTPGSMPVGPWTIARRPLMVGMLHGLAGSGALTALITATIPSIGSRLIYLLLFGAGSTCGMAALSGLMGWPIARVGTNGVVARGVSVAVGSISIMLGLYWAYPLIGRALQIVR
jgi:nitrile hydratase accessory protein